MEFHNGCTLIDLRVSQWRGMGKAHDTDYRNDGGELPPADIVKRGQKKIFPSEALTRFDTLRKKAERTCLVHGTKFASSFLVANESLQATTDALDVIAQEYEVAKEDFFKEFDTRLAAWIDENQQHERIIRHDFDKDYLKERFSFGYRLLEITPISEEAEEDFADQILHEIGVLCSTAADNLVDRKKDIKGERLASKLDPMIAKLNALAFGNGKLRHLLSEFEQLAEAIPKEDLLKHDSHYVGHVVHFLSTCSSERRLQSILSGDFSVHSLIHGLHGKQLSEANTEQLVTLQSHGSYF